MNLQSETLILEMKRCLVERCQKNPAYSMRAFAKNLAVSPSYLSQVLSGKRSLSPEKSRDIMATLGLEVSMVKTIEEELKTPAVSNMNGNPSEKFTALNVDIFEVIHHWYHYAILHAVDLSDFKSDINWISRRINLNPNIVKQAVEDLVKVGLLDCSKDPWVKLNPRIKVDNKKPTPYTIQFQREMVANAQKALEELPHHRRDITSSTVAINKDQLEFARQRISQFRKQLLLELEDQNPGKTTDVYNLAIQFFPSTLEINNGDIK